MSNPEILPVKDRTTVQNQTDRHDGVWSQLAQDAYSVAGSIGREGNLLAQGMLVGSVKEGYNAFAHNTKQTVMNLAETVGIGAALAVASKAGPMPIRLLAAGASAYFGYQMTDWMKHDVFNGDRWKRIGSAMGDTWNSNAHMARNIGTVQKDLGLLTFDSAVMLGGGALGAKLGSAGVRIGSNIEVPGLRFGNNLELATVPAVEEMQHLNADVRQLDPNNPFSKADKVMKSTKTEVTRHGLDGLQDALREAKMRDLSGKDEMTVELRNKTMPELAKQNAELQKAVNQLTVDLTGKRTELKATETLSVETKALKDAETRLQSLERDVSELPAKKAELRSFEEQISAEQRAREDAKKHGGNDHAAAKKGKDSKGGEAEAAAPQEDIQEKARELRKDISEKETTTDRKNANSAIMQAEGQQTAARSALEVAEQQKPARVEALQGEIAGLQKQIDQHTGQQADLGKQMQTAVDSYYGRLAEIMHDPSVLKLAQAMEVKEVKEVKTTRPPRQAQAQNGDNHGAAGSTGDKPVAQAAERSGGGAATKAAAVTEVKKDGAAGSAGDKPVAQVAERSAGGAETKAAAVTEVKKDSAGATEEKKDAQTREVKEKLPPEEQARLDAVARAKTALGTAKPIVTEARTRLQAIDKATTARKQAREVLDTSTQDLSKIESGQKTFADETAKQQAIEELKARQEKARADMTAAQEAVKRVGSGQYFQAMKGINRYALAVEDYFAKETDPARRQEFAKEAAKNLDAIVDELPKARQGVNPPHDNLNRRGLNGNDMQRVTEIREHIEKRLEQMDSKHDARLGKIQQLPAVKQAFEKITSGEARNEVPEAIKENLLASQQRILNGAKPERISERDWGVIQSRARKVDIDALANDGSNIDAVYKHATVVFFDQQGKLIGSTGTDGKFRPKYFDASAILKGPGRGGAGVDRLIGENPSGFAILAPKPRMSFGGRMELHQLGTNTKGDPVFNKEVVSVGGKVPEFVIRGTPANKLSAVDTRGRGRGSAPRDGKVAETEKKPESAA